MPLTLQLGRGATEHILQRSLPAGASEHVTLAMMASHASDAYSTFREKPSDTTTRRNSTWSFWHCL